ncbi:hypothetical protein BJF79_31200 [Actinomadura sp. CNU-125]|uniref:AfsR/SARP family transcriptional regulator n=1 Tax=Actinomadura sp. CNU-125 TaxID=1904961 RepID=UPI000963276C|nr:BTAD domain-containing putative transcriptional regulator [Actinomadura sp. CNU-125]OLT36346.1 hypothetical protein BJF79_31200 [Actinomadura sp. CNU-125]
MLAHLALHPSGSTRDRCIDALWPDHQPDAAGALLQAAISSTRKVLRTTTGLGEAMFIVRASNRYQIDSDLIDIDLEHLTHALAQARQAATDAQHLRLLQTLTTHYTGHFAEDLTHEWAQAHRTHLRRTTLDTLTDLAHHIQEAHPEQALHALEHAITHDPYAEPLYRTIMQLQARLERPDAVQRTYRLLTEHLTNLDAEPDSQTHQLFTTLQSGNTLH